MLIGEQFYILTLKVSSSSLSTQLFSINLIECRGQKTTDANYANSQDAEITFVKYLLIVKNYHLAYSQISVTQIV